MLVQHSHISREDASRAPIWRLDLVYVLSDLLCPQPLTSCSYFEPGSHHRSSDSSDETRAMVLYLVDELVILNRIRGPRPAGHPLHLLFTTTPPEMVRGLLSSTFLPQPSFSGSCATTVRLPAPLHLDSADIYISDAGPRIPVLLLRRHSSLVGCRSLAARRCPVRPRTAHGSGTRSTPCDVRNDARRAHQGCSADQHELAAWSTHLPPSA
jgi:hypothetical protein